MKGEDQAHMSFDYVQALVDAHPGIREVWLFGSRADGSSGPGSDYDYFAFADEGILRQLAATPSLKRGWIDLLVIFDGDNFRSPWSDEDRIKWGSLTQWHWQASADGTATYKATAKPRRPAFALDGKVGKARRVFPFA